MQIQISFPSKRKQLAGVVAIFLALSVAAACRRPAKPVKVGFIGNLTGSFSDWGIASRNGFLLAVEQINSAGGIDGRQVEVVVRNDDFSHELAAKAVEELADMGGGRHCGTHGKRIGAACPLKSPISANCF